MERSLRQMQRELQPVSPVCPDWIPGPSGCCMPCSALTCLYPPIGAQLHWGGWLWPFWPQPPEFRPGVGSSRYFPLPALS
ncbi:hypothetical protein D3C75_1053670 [compost metagenome]